MWAPSMSATPSSVRHPANTLREREERAERALSLSGLAGLRPSQARSPKAAAAKPLGQRVAKP